MSPKLALIARKMARQTPEQAPAPEGHGLGAAIEKLIADEVERRVGEVMEQEARVRDQFRAPAPVTDYRQLPQVPRAQPPKEPLNMTIHRDGGGLITWCEASDGTKIQTVRDGAGNMIAMREVSESPVLPALEIPFKGEARQYQPGVPRKLYGNTPENHDEHDYL